MSVYRINALALAISISLFGCLFRRNPNYCEGRNEHNNCSEPPYSDAMPELRCPDETTCEAPTGVCKEDTGRCVQCTPENKAACTGTTPICGEDYACRGCMAHNDCASTSNVCLPDGACAAESEVAYVGPGGSGTTCSKAQPCTLDNALDGTRAYIKVTGTLTENVKVQNKRHVTVLADAGAKLTPKSDGILLELEGESNLTMYDLELSGAQGGAGHAISMLADNQSTLTLHRVNIVKNTGAGIIALGGTLNIYRSTIAENAGGGINMVGATTFDIRNNFIVRNGSDSSEVGGIKANPAGSTNKLEFNTIVGNKAGSALAKTGGAVCADTSAPFNLVFDNIRVDGFADPQVFGNCNFGQSLTTAPAGGAKFTSNDYHLTAATPAGPGPGGIRDVVACTAAEGFVDIDGEKRPKNGLCDLGADEY